MIPPTTFRKYAQYNEDIVLKALLFDVEKGFYVDVGAAHPVEHSVTKLFYDQGWHGINIEPNPTQYERLKRQRKRDINLNIGIASKNSKLELRVYHSKDKIEGLSTFSSTLKNRYSKAKSEDTEDYSDVDIKTYRLKDILNEHVHQKIDFLKVDVEGLEYEVVTSNDWKKFRPEVICIEANHIMKDWRGVLESNSYKLFISDGLNNYYVAEESWDRTSGFAERATVLSHDSISDWYFRLWREDIKNLKSSLKRLDNLELENKRLRSDNVILSSDASLSLLDQPLRKRVKRSAYGLTVDWIKFKRQARRSINEK